jgi:mono/diheme cytochrome c family protein
LEGFKRKIKVHKTFLAFFFGVSFLSCTNPEQLKKDRYISLGLSLYIERCSQCHGTDGKGLGTLYPPLSDSDFLFQNPDSVPCFIKNGKLGPLIVNGIGFDQPMPANPDLLDEEISQLINYIKNAWGNTAEFYSVEKVEEKLKNCN